MPRERERQEDQGGAARAFWSGTLTFGLVSIPVELYAAVRPRRVSLRMLGPEGKPLQRRYYCSKEERPLDRDDIVRGYELEKDQFIIVGEEELEALEPRKTRDIDLRRFVPRHEIDPMLLDRPYVLAPAGQSSKAYHLLVAAMEKSQRAGIATFVMRGKEYLAAIFADRGLLHAATLRWADEVRTPEQVELPEPAPAPAKLRRELESAIRALEKDRLDVGKLHDVEAEQIYQLAERKRRERRDVIELAEVPAEEPDEGQVVDIMELLRQRVESATPKTAARKKPAAGAGRTRAHASAGHKSAKRRQAAGKAASKRKSAGRK